MLNRKQAIRTYQRKTAKKPLASLAPVKSIEKFDPVGNNRIVKNGAVNDSLNYDPFETTFDRIAKGAIVPPFPSDANQNDSWYNSSSDSNINTASIAKSFQCAASNLSTPINGSSLTHINIELTYARKRPRRCLQEVVVSKEMVPKKTRAMLTESEVQSQNIQEPKKQIHKTGKKKKKKGSELKKSSRKCNKQISCADSNTKSNLEDAIRENNVSWNDEHWKVNTITSAKNATAGFGHTSNCYQQNVKPCFVKLNACTVQNWYILNPQKIAGDEQDALRELSHTSALQANKENISETRNTIPQLISTEYNNVNSEHSPIKQCSVMLSDNIVKDWYASKTSNNSSNTASKLKVSHSPKLASYCNNSIESALCNTQKDRRDLVKDSFVKVEKLKMEKFIKPDVAVLNDKVRQIISSTPISARIRPSACSVMISPISTDIHKYLITTTKDAADITFPDKFSDRKDSFSLITLPKSCRFDTTQKRHTQLFPSSRDLLPRAASVKIEGTPSFEEEIHTALTQEIKAVSFEKDIRTELTQKIETVSFEEDICTALTQKYNINCDGMGSISADQSRSLFGDTTYSHNHLAEDTIGHNLMKKHFANVLPTKTDIALSDDLSLEKKQSLNDNTDVTTLSSIVKDLDDIARPKWEDECKEDKSAKIKSMEDYESSKDDIVNDSKRSFLSKGQSNIGIADTPMPIQLQDPVRITVKRIQYPKWCLSVSDISKSLNNETAQSDNKAFHVTANKASDVRSTTNDFEHSRHAGNSPRDHHESLSKSDQLYDNDTIKEVERSVFLKPGKCWARSLSILNNINNGSNLDQLSIGKGKKWRQSVRDILDMQKQGIFQSCLKDDKDDTGLSRDGHDASNVSSSFDGKSKARSISRFSTANHVRFSKRISVRVVLNNTNIKCNVKDAPFLEAFGILAEESPSSQLSHRKESPTSDNRFIRSPVATARDVVLQRCSQNRYLPFSDCFPDTFLEHCRKIGEGVYGEVFLYEHNDRRSVIKIIPIEGEELVNGEPQKKFSEILSEIVIAKELDNLRLNSTYRTSGFVEVRGINCITGRYPKRLVELWSIYDDDKTSDNDCPSMFGENQLYITLELSHGGEDLEAFVFQTAKEARASFLQIALALAVAEKALEFEHRDLHWGNVLISRTKEPYVYYNLGGKEIRLPSSGMKVSIIDFTLSRMLYQRCCIYNDLALDPALFTAHGEYQFEIYRLMRDKIQNDWRKFEPYTNVLWLHYTLDKMITAVRYKKKNLKVHKDAIVKLKEFKDTILNYDSACDFVMNSNSVL